LSKYSLVFLVLLATIFISGCKLASPFDKLITMSENPATPVAEAVVHTLRPTFTPTPNWTATPTNTPTPVPTATPLNTPTPAPTATPENTSTPEATHTPENTPTPEATNTPKPVSTRPPPPPTETPGPTNTPLPRWDYILAENFAAPSTANILSIMVAIQDSKNNWIGGMRVVGTDPNGIVTKSEPSAPQEIGHTPAGSSVIKSGNVKFEPQPRAVYITGTWSFHLETADGKQVSDSFSVTMDEENRSWYFFRFAPN